MDYSRRIVISLANGTIEHWDPPSGPFEMVRHEDIEVRFTAEQLRNRAIQAYVNHDPFAEAGISDHGLTYRVPKFHNFTHWMSHRHLRFAQEDRAMAMFQINVYERSSRTRFQYVWIDAATGEVIAIRILDLGGTLGSPIPQELPYKLLSDQWKRIPLKRGSGADTRRAVLSKDGRVLVGEWVAPNRLRVAAGKQKKDLLLDAKLAQSMGKK